MPSQIKPSKPLWRQPISEILDMLLPQSEDLAFPAWDYEDENNEDIFNTESENEPLFFLPTQDDLSPALSRNTANEVFTSLQEGIAISNQLLLNLAEESENIRSREEILSRARMAISNYEEELERMNIYYERISQSHSMEHFEPERPPALQTQISSEHVTFTDPLSINSQFSRLEHFEVERAPALQSRISPEHVTFTDPLSINTQFSRLEHFEAERAPALQTQISSGHVTFTDPLFINTQFSRLAHPSNLANVSAQQGFPLAPVMYVPMSPATSDRPSLSPYPPDAQTQTRTLPVLFQDDYEEDEDPASKSPSRSPSPAHLQGHASSGSSSSAPPPA